MLSFFQHNFNVLFHVHFQADPVQFLLRSLGKERVVIIYPLIAPLLRVRWSNQRYVKLQEFEFFKMS